MTLITDRAAPHVHFISSFACSVVAGVSKVHISRCPGSLFCQSWVLVGSGSPPQSSVALVQPGWSFMLMHTICMAFQTRAVRVSLRSIQRLREVQESERRLLLGPARCLGPFWVTSWIWLSSSALEVFGLCLWGHPPQSSVASTRSVGFHVQSLVFPVVLGVRNGHH